MDHAMAASVRWRSRADSVGMNASRKTADDQKQASHKPPMESQDPETCTTGGSLRQGGLARAAGLCLCQFWVLTGPGYI